MYKQLKEVTMYFGGYFLYQAKNRIRSNKKIPV